MLLLMHQAKSPLPSLNLHQSPLLAKASNTANPAYNTHTLSIYIYINAAECSNRYPNFPSTHWWLLIIPNCLQPIAVRHQHITPNHFQPTHNQQLKLRVKLSLARVRRRGVGSLEEKRKVKKIEKKRGGGGLECSGKMGKNTVLHCFGALTAAQLKDDIKCSLEV